MRRSLWVILACALVMLAGVLLGAAVIKSALEGAQVVSENTMDVLMGPRAFGRAPPASGLEGGTSERAGAAVGATPTRSVGVQQ